jgi:MtN3 and saliva related transmembrane protein
LNRFIIDAVGVAAALCSMASFVPQVLKLLRERDVSGVSLRMYVATVAGFALWTAYGWLLGQWPLIAANSISFLLAAWVLALKVRFGFRRAKG